MPAFINIIMNVLITGVLIFCCTHNVLGTIDDYVSTSDTSKMQKILVTKEPTDIPSIYYTVRGLSLLKSEGVPNGLCTKLEALYRKDLTSELLYQYLAAWKLLKCQQALPQLEDIYAKLATTLADKQSSIDTLRYAAQVLNLMDRSSQIDKQAVWKNVLSIIQKNETLINLGHSFHIASLIGLPKSSADRVADVILQADEVDGKILQWEGGLSVTSMLIDGVTKVGTFTSIQADKLGTYLLSRRTVQTPKGVVALLEALNSLNSIPSAPICIHVENKAIDVENGKLLARVVDILGNDKGLGNPVTAQSATRVIDDVVVLSKQNLVHVPKTGTYELTLKVDPGVYRVVLSIGDHTAAVQVRVIGKVPIHWLEIGVSETDRSQPSFERLTPGRSLNKQLQASYGQRLVSKLSLGRNVHQVFYRVSSNDGKEIVFIAETEGKDLIYKLDVDLSKELLHSGVYNMELLLGDSVMSNPIRWKLGSIDVHLKQDKQVAPSAHPKRAPKPTIEHMFRPKDKRPPQAVSLFFSGFALAPLILLIVLWSCIQFKLSCPNLTTIAFHVGFGGILALYILFWLKLDMFTTCLYLMPIGGITFLSGHRMLCNIVALKKSKKE